MSLLEEYQSWSGIIENPKVAESFSLTRFGTEKWHNIMGFTISPPKVDYSKVSYELFIYIYLMPLQYIFEEYETEVYVEFSKEGRLHFHGKVEYTNENYGTLYRLLNALEYSYESRGINRFVCRTVSGKKKVVKFNRKAMVKSELHIHDSKMWNEYICKDATLTGNIIKGLSKFVKVFYNKDTFKDLQTYIISRYNIEN